LKRLASIRREVLGYFSSLSNPATSVVLARLEGFEPLFVRSQEGLPSTNTMSIYQPGSAFMEQLSQVRTLGADCLFSLYPHKLHARQ
jgi:hypothetical protein